MMEGLSQYKLSIGYFESLEFLLPLGNEYKVMGVILAEDLITYLIDDGNFPYLYPFHLFEVIDNSISNKWHFKMYQINDELFSYARATWGYYESCFADNH